jgi:signal transduction histidine kinase
VARQATAQARPQAELLSAELHLELCDESVLVRADLTHLNRIIDSLISNALAYSRGTPWVKVSVHAADQAVLEVEDRGIGIPPEMRERIFERFVRLNDPEVPVQAGTGLGLYISRELAHRQGAELAVVRSEPDGGSTLALRLDLARPAVSPTPA